ncbi:MAG: hypothetical protein ACE5G9_07360, partial [Nitrospinales bacterium]
MDHPLEKEFEYFIEHHEELVEKFNGKFVIIKDLQVLGAYDDIVQAIQETQKQNHEIGTFLVQKVSPGDEAYT